MFLISKSHFGVLSKFNNFDTRINIFNMDISTVVTLAIILITGVTSYMGFQNYLNNPVFQRFCLHVGSILGKDRQWDRLLTSSLVHADWMHLLFNMMTLWFFAPVVISAFGIIEFFVIYIGAIFVGSLLSLWIHRKNYSYTAIGASGGVMGVIFAFIAIAPEAELYFFFIPIPIPAWIFGVIYLSISVYSFNKSIGNIGHDAHIGGAIVGIVTAILYKPEYILQNWIYVAINIIPIIIFIVYLRKKR